MVGVCLTVIGLIRIVITIREKDTIADDLLSADSFMFLISCTLSYWAPRTEKCDVCIEWSVSPTLFF